MSPTSLLSTVDKTMIEAAAKAALPTLITVVGTAVVFDVAGGYALDPEIRFFNLGCRIAPAGLPFLTGTNEAPDVTSYHFLYVPKANPILLSDYIFVGDAFSDASFISLGQYNYNEDQSLVAYLVKRVNVHLMDPV